MGGLLGWFKPEWGVETAFLRNIFLNLVKVIIAPLVFSSIVAGIAGGGELKKVGRMGIKALLYFEIVTTLALIIGLAAVNIAQPGYGVVLQAAADDLGSLQQYQPKTFIETVLHLFPSNFIESMARGDVLQIVVFSILFGLAVSALARRASRSSAGVRASHRLCLSLPDML